MDGLCLTEYQIGAPIYALTRQLRTCTAQCGCRLDLGPKKKSKNPPSSLRQPEYFRSVERPVVCTMAEAFVRGVLDGAGVPVDDAVLDPSPTGDRCCVTIARAGRYQA